MNNFEQTEIDKIINFSLKNNYESSLINNRYKRYYISYRKDLISEIKNLITYNLNDLDNKNEIFYLSIFYLDIILSKNKIILKSENNRKLLFLSCLIISIKFLGAFDLCKNRIKNLIKSEQQNYSSFETKCVYLLNYNLHYTTVFDYINLILQNSNDKLLNTCKNLLLNFIEDNNFINYSPFLTAIAIYKYSKDKNKINKKNIYDKYFKDETVKEIENYLKKEYKNINNDLIDDNKSDIKTMSSTLEIQKYKNKSLNKNLYIITSKENNKSIGKNYNITLYYSINNNNNYKECDKRFNTTNNVILNYNQKIYNNNIYLSNQKELQSNEKLQRTEKKINDTNKFNLSLMTKEINLNKKRNLSSGNMNIKKLSTRIGELNKRLVHNNNINRLGIDLGQISKLSFDKLQKISRFFKN